MQRLQLNPAPAMSNKVILFILIISGSISVEVSAQRETKEITHQNLYWLRYYNKLELGKDWTLNTEIEDRRYFIHNRQHQWLLPRIAMGKKFSGGWSAAAGFAYFRQSLPHSGNSKIDITIPELRSHQEISHQLNLREISLSHRYTVEERFIKKANEGHLSSEYSFNFRFRYRLQFGVSFIKKEKLKGSLSFKVFDEIMINLGRKVVRNTFDQNRFGIGIGYGISDHIELQVEAFNWFQQRPDGDRYFSRNILRFTVHHIIKLKD